MLFSMFGHPSYEALSEFTDATTSRSQARVARHLAGCAECRAAVQALRTAHRVLRDATPDPLPASLRDRILTSRANGAGIILPTSNVERRTGRGWVLTGVTAAAIVIAVLAEGLSMQQAEAGDTSGTMTLAPAMPRAGQQVRVQYKAPMSLSHFSVLTLRARLRTRHDPAYENGISVRTVGRLVRGKSGTYSAEFTVPDSVVYVALVVEDSTGAIVDDQQKRAWELLVTVDGKRPSLEALEQRANDMMGRSFEEGHATTRRMVALYPDSIRGWSYLHSFEVWMGLGEVDSLLSKHRAAFAHIEKHWREAAVVPGAVIGRLAWYSRTVDTASGAYWRARLMREAPTDGFALQWRLGARLSALAKNRDTTAALRGLDSLWDERNAERAGQIAGSGLTLAMATQRPDVIDQWWERVRSVSRDKLSSEITFADQLSRVPTLAPLAVDRLRRLLPRTDSVGSTDRFLTETSGERNARAAMRGRRVLASLGRALVASGNTRGGLDTLMLAARGGWDLNVVRAIRAAAFAAGDSATGWAMTARLVVDPSTPEGTRDPFAATGRRAVGEARWTALEQDAARLFAARMLESSRMRSIPGTARLRDAQGSVKSLKEIDAGRVTVVVFWSRFCGWALDDVDDLGDVARRLEKTGGQLIMIIDDETGPSPALTAVLTEHNVKVSPYFDVDHSTSKAFNNWGTPQYYVLDESGRLRFDEMSTAPAALVRAEALRLSSTSK